MFKANCDICRKDVTDIMKLKVLEPRLQSKGIKDICDKCQLQLNEVIAKFGKQYGDKVVQDGQDWLQAHQKAKSGIITAV